MTTKTESFCDELLFVEKILDNVHGFIGVTETESKIIELPVFRRLQGIKQLSLVSWIFPGSEHTRFAHSIGVMHIADQMAIQLKLTNKQRRTVRLAGLLHDIGHYPLSHLFEKVYSDDIVVQNPSEFIEQFNKRTKGKIDDSFKNNVKVEWMSKNSNSFHHERIGVTIIENNKDIQDIVRAGCPDVCLDDIYSIITGAANGSDIDILTQIIHSEIDADGIDYMLRDALFSGTSFGSFEMDQLIRNLEKRKIGSSYVVGIKPHGISAADQFLVNKYFTYTQVLNNKHTTILEAMAEISAVILVNFTDHLPKKPSLETIFKDTNNQKSSYLKFKDDLFWKALYEMDKSLPTTFPYLSSIISNLLIHKELKYVELSECKLTTSDLTELTNSITQSQVYKKIEGNRKSVVLFGEVRFTKHVPVDVFIGRLKTKRNENGETEDEELLKTALANRLMDGMAVIDDDIHLLCDDKRSLMRNLYQTKFVVVREYEIN